jgi:hypothetical protein
MVRSSGDTAKIEMEAVLPFMALPESPAAIKPLRKCENEAMSPGRRVLSSSIQAASQKSAMVRTEVSGPHETTMTDTSRNRPMR